MRRSRNEDARATTGVRRRGGASALPRASPAQPACRCRTA
jgi:hypothetical protein